LIYGRDSIFTVKTKHIPTLAITATNNWEYCCGSHTTRLRQLGATYADLAEVMVVVDTTKGESQFAEGTRRPGAAGGTARRSAEAVGAPRRGQQGRIVRLA
jgi:AhpD family alkylhydroperoxidase